VTDPDLLWPFEPGLPAKIELERACRLLRICRTELRWLAMRAGVRLGDSSMTRDAFVAIRRAAAAEAYLRGGGSRTGSGLTAAEKLRRLRNGPFPP